MVIEKIGATNMKDMGKVMGIANKQLAWKAIQLLKTYTIQSFTSTREKSSTRTIELGMIPKSGEHDDRFWRS